MVNINNKQGNKYMSAEHVSAFDILWIKYSGFVSGMQKDFMIVLTFKMKFTDSSRGRQTLFVNLFFINNLNKS